MPFAYNQLASDIQSQVTSVVILSPTQHADFKIHLRNLLALDGSDQYPVLPELEQMGTASVNCLYGEEENADWLPKDLPAFTKLTILPGGHHYENNYPLLVQTLQQSLSP